MSSPNPPYVYPTLIDEPEFDINFYKKYAIKYLNDNYDITTIRKIASYYIPVMIDDGRQFYTPREEDRKYILDKYYYNRTLFDPENQGMLFLQRHIIKNENKHSECIIGLPIVDVCIANRLNKDNSENNKTGGKKYNKKTRKNKQRGLKKKIN